jgi:hypothetical protein
MPDGSIIEVFGSLDRHVHVGIGTSALQSLLVGQARPDDELGEHAAAADLQRFFGSV